MSFPDDKVLFRVTIPWPLRISAKSTASFGGLRMRADGVVPFRMEQVACDIEGFHLGVADFDALFVGACVERALDAQSGFGRGCLDQFDDGQSVGERSAAPRLRDVAEQSMLDLVPLRRARRIVMDVDDEPCRIGEFLQFDFPQPDTRSIRAAAVGRDRQFAGIRVAFAPHLVEPATDGGDRDLGRIGIDADTYEAGFARYVVDAVWHELSQILVLEIGDLPTLGL